MKRIRILLADDHAVVRQGFKMILGAQADMEIVGEAANGREAVELAAQLNPDIVVMDVNMPGTSGVDGVSAIRAAGFDAPIVMLTVSDSERDMIESIARGAAGYLTKANASAELTHYAISNGLVE